MLTRERAVLNGVFAGQGISRGLTTETGTCCEGPLDAGIRRSEALRGQAETRSSRAGKTKIDGPNVPFCTDPHERVPLLRSAAQVPQGVDSRIDHLPGGEECDQFREAFTFPSNTSFHLGNRPGETGT